MVHHKTTSPLSTEYYGAPALIVTIRIIAFPVVLFLMGMDWMSRVWKKSSKHASVKKMDDQSIIVRIQERLIEKKKQMARAIPLIASDMYGDIVRKQIKEARREMHTLEKKMKELEKKNKPLRATKSERVKNITTDKLRARTEEILRTVYKCDGSYDQPHLHV
jgi:hypothetical protein